MQVHYVWPPLADFYGIVSTNDFDSIRVRGPKNVDALSAIRKQKELPYVHTYELRGKKHTFGAIALDKLGNCTVLTKKGTVYQVLGNELKAAGITF